MRLPVPLNLRALNALHKTRPECQGWAVWGLGGPDLMDLLWDTGSAYAEDALRAINGEPSVEDAGPQATPCPMRCRTGVGGRAWNSKDHCALPGPLAGFYPTHMTGGSPKQT